jgi:uroporphyrinogen III methyltransferase/synthase
MKGTVYLVGAGPGDPGLLTLRGVECLRRADVVLRDYLASPALLEHAPAGVEHVTLGDPRAGRSMTPDEITARMIDEARRGRTVVRLKGGDPMIFGRAAEELAALRAAGIPYEIVPGITAGLAAAAYGEIPVTHHEVSPAFAVVTARERDVKAAPALDHAALAAFPGTLAVYMGVGRAAAWCRALIEHGKPADTPVAIVQWCSTPRQRTVRCTLGSVAEAVERAGIESPAAFIVGAAVDLAPAVSWFESRLREDTT